MIARYLVAVLIGLGVLLASSEGAVVYLKGETQPLVGVVESADETSITLRRENNDGEIVSQRILREEIEVLLQGVDPDRLAQLSPDNPQGYREYAEELAVQTVDPEAVETATRLFLIAAWLDPENQGRSALLGLTPLMTDPQQVKQLRGLAYLLDPAHDASLLEGSSALGAGRNSGISDELRQDVVQVLRFLRRGQRSNARQLLERQEIRAALAKATNKITPIECDQLVQGSCPGCQEGNLPPYLLQKLLAAELELTSRKRDSAAQTQWGFFLDESFQKPLPVLSLRKATPLDPRQSVYRNGKWVEPSQAPNGATPQPNQEVKTVP